MTTSQNLMGAYDSMACRLVRTAMHYQACGCMEAPACVRGFRRESDNDALTIQHWAVAQERRA